MLKSQYYISLTLPYNIFLQSGVVCMRGVHFGNSPYLSCLSKVDWLWYYTERGGTWDMADGIWQPLHCKQIEYQRGRFCVPLPDFSLATKSPQLIQNFYIKIFRISKAELARYQSFIVAVSLQMHSHKSLLSLSLHYSKSNAEKIWSRSKKFYNGNHCGKHEINNNLSVCLRNHGFLNNIFFSYLY